MPLYNVGQFLDETLSTIACQTFRDYEVIMVDDGSTDDTAAIAKRRVEEDDRFRYVFQENSGAACARNNGMSEANGKYLCFLDGDDLFDRRMFERMASSLEETNADLCLCKYSEFDSKTGNRLPAVGPYPALRGLHKAEDYLGRLFQDISDQPWDKMYRRDFVLASGVKFQNIAASNDLFFTKVTLALSSRAYFLDQSLVSYRVASGTSIQDKKIKHPTCAMMAMKAVYEEAKRRNILAPICESFRFAYSSALNSCAALVADKAPEFLGEALQLWRDVEKDFEKSISTSLGLGHAILFWLRRRCFSRATVGKLTWVYAGGARSRTDGAPSALSKVKLAVRLFVAGFNT